MKDMHEITESGLESYLSGAASNEFHVHLARCRPCREAVEEIRAVSATLGVLRPDLNPDDIPVAVPLGFSFRVLASVRQTKSRSLWSIFARDTAFTRRLAFASLLTLAIFGGYFASTPESRPDENTPEAVMAHHDTAHDADSANMLLTLASYRN